MGQAIENLNNAIVAIDRETQLSRTASKGVKAAVKAMGDHWFAFWRSSERATMPDVVLTPKLKRYLGWYTRAWLIVPKDVRAKVPDPKMIDAEWTAFATDAIKLYTDQARDSVQGAKDQAAALADFVDRKAGELAIAAGKTAQNAIYLGVGVLAALWWFSREKKK